MRNSSDSGASVPSISDAEWAVMRVIWQLGSGTANEIISGLGESKVWKPATVHTLLRRLRDKSVLGHEKRGRAFVFFPLVEERDCQLAVSQSFLNRVFGGGLAPLVAAFAEREHLSSKEIDELKQILADATKEESK